MCDHVSTLLFSPTKAGYDNLVREGFSMELTAHPDTNHPNIYRCGDIMYDNTLHFRQEALNDSFYYEKFDENNIFCTIHRNANTDDKSRLTTIFSTLVRLSENSRILLPLHSRIRKMMTQMLGSCFTWCYRKEPKCAFFCPWCLCQNID